MKKGHIKPEPAKPRKQAGEPLKKIQAKNGAILSEEETPKLVHELEVQQIEVEMQNDELKLAKERVELEEKYYTGLFDSAPFGYLSLTKEGEITVLNFSAARMLGRERSLLVKNHFVSFVSSDTKSLFNDFWEKIFQSGSKETCKIKLSTEKGGLKPVLIEGIVSESGEQCLLTLIDITRIKRSEEELRQNEGKYRGLIDIMNDTAWIIGFDGKFIDVNERAVEVFGYSREEFLSMRPRDIDSSLTEDQIKDLIKQMMGGTRRVFETEHTTKKGDKFPVEISSSLVTYDGKPAILSIARDITERKREEKKIFELSLRQEVLLSAIPDIVMEVDNNKVYTWANRIGIAFFGDDVIGKEAAFYFEGEQETYQTVQPLFEGNEDVFYVESWQRRKDGEKRLLGWWCRVLKDENGKVTGALSSAQDITEQRKAEYDLRESEERFRVITSNTPDHIIMHDTDLRYTFVLNPQIGLTEADMLGKTDFDILTKEEAEYLTGIKRKVLETGEPVHLETSLLNAKNEPEYFDGSFVPKFDSNGKVNGLIGYIRNVTEHKQDENALSEYKELFSLFMQFSPVYTYIKEVTPTESRVLQASENFLEMVGISGSEMVGKTMEELYPLEFARKMTADDWSVVSQGKVLQLDEDFNGRSYTSIKFPIIRSDKKLLAGYTFDITERKQMEEALKKNEAQLTAFMNFVPDLILIKDSEFRPVFANEKYRSLFPIDKWLGKKPAEVFPPEIAEVMTEKDTEAMEKGYTVYEEEWADQQGEKHIFNTQKFRIPIPGMQPLLGAIISDITGRKRTEDALLFEQYLLHSLMDNSPDSIYFKDLDSRFIRCNKSMAQKCGFNEAEELLGKSDFDLFVNSHAIEAFNDEQEIIKSGIPVISKEECEEWITGITEWVLTTKLPLYDTKGKIVGTFGVSRNISERKKAETAMHESEKRATRQRAAIVKIATEKNLSEIDISDGFHTLTRIVSGAIKVARTSIWLFADNDTKLECLSLYEADNHKHSSGLSLQNKDIPVYIKTLRRESRIYASDVQTDARTFELTGNYLIPLGISSMLDAGVFIEGKLVGVVCLEHIGDKRSWEADEEAFASTIATIVSQAIINSERLRAKKALEESEERYRSFITQVSDGVYRFECDQPMDINLPLEEQVDFIYDHMFIAECNDAFLKMYRINDPKEMIGKGFIAFLGSRTDEKNRNLLRNFIKNDFHVENSVREDSNTPGQRYFFNNNFLGIVENNHLVRMWGTQVDITEKIKSDLVQQVLFTISNAALSPIDLKELTALIRTELGKLLDTTNFYIAFYDENTGMLSTSYITDEKDQIETWPAEKSATGYVIRHQRSLLITDIDVIKLMEAGEIEMVGTPSKVWLGVPLWVGNKVIGAIVVQDYNNKEAYNEKDKLMLEFISAQISVSIERKIAEQELKAALAKAQESERLKLAFLANMSHEIRTPMNGILGFSELLKNPELSGNQQQEYIEIIEKSGRRMLNIINDLIDISKVEAGLMDITFSKTNINEQMEYLSSFFKPEAEKKGIQLSTRISLFGEYAVIKIDREKLFSILTNLVKNAIKYTNEGSIEFGYVLKDQNLEFYVKDTGIGIASEWHEKIFQRFIQADIANKNAYQGAGLGLSITKAYVEMLEGKIWIESEPGKGSVFYFTIPYQPVKIENASGKKLPEDEVMVSRKLKLLIAEDDPASEMFLSISLKTIAEEILLAKTGKEAVEISRNNPDIDLILMDIQLPEMDGYEASRQIREFNKKVIIIAETAYGFPSDRDNALAAGCNDYISKPINKENLMELIGKYF